MALRSRFDHDILAGYWFVGERFFDEIILFCL